MQTRSVRGAAESAGQGLGAVLRAFPEALTALCLSQNAIHSHIRLFEPLVIKALKQYTTTTSVQLQRQVLDLLAQLVQLRVNYCLLDSDQVCRSVSSPHCSRRSEAAAETAPPPAASSAVPPASASQQDGPAVAPGSPHLSGLLGSPWAPGHLCQRLSHSLFKAADAASF